MSVPNLVVEVAFAANPLDEVSARLNVVGIDNSAALTPDANSLDISGDIEMVVRAATSDWTRITGPGFQTLIGKESRATTKISYSLYLLDSGHLTLAYSTNGTTITTVQANAVVPFIDASRYWIKCTFDVNNGAGGKSVAFYWAPDAPLEPANWTQIGTTITSAGTVTIANTTAALGIGGIDPGQYTFNGQIFRAIVRNGIDGTTVADFDPYDAHSQSISTFGSSRVANQVWTVGTQASLSISPSWSDITAYVRNQSVSINRGKQNELQTFGTSSCTMTLNNRDRRFDPDFASSPYSPNVQPAKRIRVRAEWAGTRYDLWNGYIEEWPQSYAPGNVDATVTITAFDIMALAGETELPDAALAYVAANTNLRLALREMIDGDWRDEINGVYLRKRTGLTATDTSNPAVGNGTPVSFNGSTWYSTGALTETNGGLPVFPPATNNGYWSCWFKTSTAGPSATNWMLILGNAYPSAPPTYASALRIGIDSSGKLRYIGYDFNPGAFPTAASTVAVNDGAWHHLVVTQFVSAGATSKIYIDGRDVTDPTSTTFNAGAESGVQVIGGPTLANSSDTRFTGSLMDVFVGDGTLTDAQVFQWYQLARGYLPESSSERATRLIGSVAGYSTHQTITAVPKATVAAIDTQGTTLLANLQRNADSEQGRLFADRYGRIRMDDRYWWQSSVNGRVSQATLSDDGSDAPYANVTSTRSRREIQNDITVAGSNGIRYRATDATSITTYGRRTGSITTNLAAQTDIVSMATGLVTLRKNPVSRTGAITVRPMTATSQWPTVLELEIGDRITFELMPARYVTSTSQYTRTLIIERIDWQLAVGNWSMVITGSPVPTQTLFRWGTSLLGGSDVLGY